MVINSDAEDLAAVAKGIQHVVELTQSKSSRLTSEASCGDQMLYGEDVSSGSSQKQQEGYQMAVTAACMGMVVELISLVNS